MRTTVRVPLRWGDMDALGHVNNATTVQLLEQARVTGWFDGQREVVDVVVRRPTLDDVFLQLKGHTADGDGPADGTDAEDGDR